MNEPRENPVTVYLNGMTANEETIGRIVEDLPLTILVTAGGPPPDWMALARRYFANAVSDSRGRVYGMRLGNRGRGDAVAEARAALEKTLREILDDLD